MELIGVVEELITAALTNRTESSHPLMSRCLAWLQTASFFMLYSCSGVLVPLGEFYFPLYCHVLLVVTALFISSSRVCKIKFHSVKS